MLTRGRLIFMATEGKEPAGPPDSEKRNTQIEPVLYKSRKTGEQKAYGEITFC